MHLLIPILIVLFFLLAAAVFYLRTTVQKNESFLRSVEEDAKGKKDIRKFLIDLNFLYDNPELDWIKVFERDGVEIHNTFTQQQYTGPKGVRTYRVISHLDASRISVDRMVALLNGGFLSEDLWFKDDFKGGQSLGVIEEGEEQNAWISQYISDLQMPGLKQRDFVYLLARRELQREEFSNNDHKGKQITRQVVLGYQSIGHPPLRTDLVRATQFPSLDRITLYEGGEIKWEHIMAFHVNGVLSLDLINNKYKAACEVLWNEAVNMRNYLRSKS